MAFMKEGDGRALREGRIEKSFRSVGPCLAMTRPISTYYMLKIGKDP